MGRTAAFFDLDRTLMQGSSGFQFVRAAYRAGLFSRRQMARDAYADVVFRLRGSTDAQTEVIRDRVAQWLEGVRVVDLKRLTPDILAGVLPRIYPEMLRTAYEHQDAGRHVYICTAASQEMADLLADVLVLDGAIGFRSEIVDGYYTGRPAGPFTYREGKAEEMRRLAAEHGLDLSASYAYSDSGSDLPMLRAVGHPVAVNPDAELARVAHEEGWEIVRLEKLGSRLRVGGAVMLAAALGGLGSRVLSQRSVPARRTMRAAPRRSTGRRQSAAAAGARRAVRTRW